MIDGATECVNSLRDKGFNFDVSPIQGDICDMDFRDGSFDGIYLLEAVEYVHDRGRMFDN